MDFCVPTQIQEFAAHSFVNFYNGEFTIIYFFCYILFIFLSANLDFIKFVFVFCSPFGFTENILDRSYFERKKYPTTDEGKLSFLFCFWFCLTNFNQHCSLNGGDLVCFFQLKYSWVRSSCITSTELVNSDANSHRLFNLKYASSTHSVSIASHFKIIFIGLVTINTTGLFFHTNLYLFVYYWASSNICVPCSIAQPV